MAKFVSLCDLRTTETWESIGRSSLGMQGVSLGQGRDTSEADLEKLLEHLVCRLQVQSTKYWTLAKSC